MNYYLDTEFLEGTQKKSFLGIRYGKTKPTIDLISIGMVAEDGREYYAISKDFNLYEAWNRYDTTKLLPERIKYWIRDNVLYPIWLFLSKKEQLYASNPIVKQGQEMTFSSLKKLIRKYGKTNKQIAKEIKHFCHGANIEEHGVITGYVRDENPKFYAYYADYDWVVFCWLFGNMIDLPKGYPMYCRDLKQIADEISEQRKVSTRYLKNNLSHDALSDARWNKGFHEYLTGL